METTNITLSEAINWASVFLATNSTPNTHLVQHYWMLVFDQTLTDIVLNKNRSLSEDEWTRYKSAIEAVKNNIPIQYHLGYAEFRDNRYQVNHSTLIPREETSGLVDLALDLIDEKPIKRVLDIGTGSGIIAISLALAKSDIEVIATDISKEALKLARKNAEDLGADVDFIQSDLYSNITHLEPFDLIISNPPYIAADELDLMDESVKKHEPKTALYAGEDGLDIYRRISQETGRMLKCGGSFLFEIGFRQGHNLVDIFNRTYPYSKITVHQDFMKLDRYVLVETRGCNYEN